MADSPKDIQLREQKDTIMDLKNIIKTFQATVQARWLRITTALYFYASYY